MTDKIVSLYEPSVPNWTSVDELNKALNWTDLVSQTGAEYFQSHGFSEKFTNEIIGAQTRIHYAQARRTACLLSFLKLISAEQNINSIHGLGAIVSLAASSGGGVRGGNWQIFEQFVKRSGAHIFLRTEVRPLFNPSTFSKVDVAPGGWHRAAFEPHLGNCH